MSKSERRTERKRFNYLKWILPGLHHKEKPFLIRNVIGRTKLGSYFATRPSRSSGVDFPINVEDHCEGGCWWTQRKHNSRNSDGYRERPEAKLIPKILHNTIQTCTRYGKFKWKLSRDDLLSEIRSIRNRNFSLIVWIIFNQRAGASAATFFRIEEFALAIIGS